MRPTAATRLGLGAMVVLAGVGAVDAARSDEPDLVVVLLTLGFLLVGLLLGTFTGRPLVPVRADLVRWMGARASLTGERTDDLVDRVVAAYRAGLVGDAPERPGPPALDDPVDREADPGARSRR